MISQPSPQCNKVSLNTAQSTCNRKSPVRSLEEMLDVPGRLHTHATGSKGTRVGYPEPLQIRVERDCKSTIVDFINLPGSIRPTRLPCLRGNKIFRNIPTESLCPVAGPHSAQCTIQKIQVQVSIALEVHVLDFESPSFPSGGWSAREEKRPNSVLLGSSLGLELKTSLRVPSLSARRPSSALAARFHS